jgi:tetratricopeptide (TPR) repeat protein
VAAERGRGGRPPGIKLGNRELLRYDLARLGDRTSQARRLREASEEDARRRTRKYPYLPQAATAWEWIDKGKPVAWPGHALRDLAHYIRDVTGRRCDHEDWIHPSANALRVCRAPRKPSLALQGRAADLATVKGWLDGSAGTRASVSLEGLPGVGKTELALQVAHAFAQEAIGAGSLAFPGGIFWLNAETPDLTAEWDEIARKFMGIESDHVEERVTEAIRKIERSPDATLLILDSVLLTKEQKWEDGAGKPGPLPEGPQVFLLVTTLNDYLGGTTLKQHTLGKLSPEAARDLLLAVSRRDAARLEGLPELLEALDGHPLALETSGVCLQKNVAETPRSLLDRIRHGERFERHARHTAYAVQKQAYESTVDGAFASLWEYMDDETRSAWRLAAQFEPVPVSQELARAAGLSADALEALREFHLIEWETLETGWVMHRLTRSFALGMLSPEERAALRRAFAKACTEYAAALAPGPAVTGYLRDASHFAAIRAEASEVLSPEDELELLLAVGPGVMSEKGHASHAGLEHYRRALQLAESLGSPTGRFRSLEWLWVSSFLRGDREQSDASARSIDGLVEDHPSDQIGYRVLGEGHYFAGRFPEAYHWLEKGMELERDGRHGATMRAMAASARAMQGYPDQARELHREATRIARALGDPMTSAAVAMLGNHMYILRGERQEAIDASEHARQIGIEYGMDVFKHVGEFSIARHQIMLTSPEETAVQLGVVHECLQKMADLNFVSLRRILLTPYAEICERLGLREEARDAIREALTIEWESALYLSETLRLKAAVADSHEEAVDCLVRALAVGRRQGAPWLALRAANDWVTLLTGSERAEALRVLREIRKEIAEGFDLEDVVRADRLLEQETVD